MRKRTCVSASASERVGGCGRVRVSGWAGVGGGEGSSPQEAGRYALNRIERTNRPQLPRVDEHTGSHNYRVLMNTRQLGAWVCSSRTA